MLTATKDGFIVDGKYLMKKTCMFHLDGVLHHICSAYVSDTRWRVYPVTIDIEADTIRIEGIRDDLFALWVTLEIKGFGRTCLPVDGGG
jgi:hypothetical protein